MALYVMADLHLSTETNKPMDVFGSRWQGYTEKIEKRWNSLIEDGDTVVVPGDISWALKLDDARSDMLFLDRLRGRKLIGKGNHDFWWASEKKMLAAFENWGIKSISVMHNNAYLVEDKIICSSRGWYVEPKLQGKIFDTDYEKIVSRECGRLKCSLDMGKKIREEHDCMIYVFLHFPPVFGDFVCRPIVDVLHEYGIGRVFFGHIHGNCSAPPYIEYEGIKMEIISSDFLDFYPKRVF